MKSLNNDEWPAVIYGAGPELRSVDEDLQFRSVDEGLKYIETRMETLRARLTERNFENAQLRGSLFWYRFGFWCLAVFCAALLTALFAGRVWPLLEEVLS